MTEEQLSENWRKAKDAGLVAEIEEDVHTLVPDPDASGRQFWVKRIRFGRHRPERPERTCCGLGYGKEMVLVHRSLLGKLQRTPYSEASLILSSCEHKSIFNLENIRDLLEFASEYERRVYWMSTPGSGATVPHAHAQAHVAEALVPGGLPIGHWPRARLCMVGEVTVSCLEYPAPGVVVSIDPNDLSFTVGTIQACIEELTSYGNSYNLLIFPQQQEGLIVGRRKPTCLWNRPLGGAEVGGVFINPPEGELAFDHLREVLADVGLAEKEKEAWIERIFQRLTQRLAAEYVRRSGMILATSK